MLCLGHATVNQATRTLVGSPKPRACTAVYTPQTLRVREVTREATREATCEATCEATREVTCEATREAT